jgi:hypothetical protein
MEGTSGHHEPVPFTRGWSRWPWQLPHDGRLDRLERSAKATPTFRERGRGDRGVRGSIASGAVGRKRPRSTPRLQKSRNRGSACPVSVRQSGRGCRETPGPPVMSRGALVSAGLPRGESRDSEPGTHEVRVHVIQTGGRSRLDASRVLSAGRSQDLLAQHRALARKKLEALFDAGQGRTEGESVRGRAFTIKKYALVRHAGFGSQVLQYDRRRSRAFAQLALTRLS